MDRPAKTTCCRFLERVPDADVEDERAVVADAKRLIRDSE